MYEEKSNDRIRHKTRGNQDLSLSSGDEKKGRTGGRSLRHGAT